MPPDDERTLRETLAQRDNGYDPLTLDFEVRTGVGWHEPVPAQHATASLSVVIPARNVAYCLPAVLDALAAQTLPAALEVIVVDDGSHDETKAVALEHPLAPIVISTGRNIGAGTARNLGTVAAGSDTVVYLDADMLIPPNALAEISARADENMALIGFRHNVPHQPDTDGRPVLPHFPASLYADHRVTWKPPVGVELLHTGITLEEPLDGRPMDATDDLRLLGGGQRYYDWDLPRMTVTATLAVPRRVVIDVGGFDPRFEKIGWGSEDTYLGACLIAAGLKIVPMRHVVGYHLDPPDAAESWKTKLAAWPATVALYHQLLEQPAPRGRAAEFHTRTDEILRTCEVKS